MSLQIRMFGPMTEKKKELHNLLTELGYPIFMDFLHKEDKQWRLDNKATSYFFFIDGNGEDEWMWQCIEEDPDFQITPPIECLRDGHEPILEWLDRLVEGVVVVYPHCPPPEKQLLELLFSSKILDLKSMNWKLGWLMISCFTRSRNRLWIDRIRL